MSQRAGPYCTGYRGKCQLPYTREEVLGERLGQILKDIHIPDDVLVQLQDSLRAAPVSPNPVPVN